MLYSTCTFKHYAPCLEQPSNGIQVALMHVAADSMCQNLAHVIDLKYEFIGYDVRASVINPTSV